MEAADRITIISHGKTAASMPKAGMNTQELARLMVGELPPRESVRGECSPDGNRRELKDLHAPGDHKRPVLQGVDLSLSCGESLGLAGVAGNGQGELAEAIAGLRAIKRCPPCRWRIT